MIGGFQVGPFQTNYQQVSPGPIGGVEHIKRIGFHRPRRVVLRPKIPRILFIQPRRSVLAPPKIPRLIFASKRVGSTMILKPAFNFISAMGVTDTISTAVVTATVFTGVDPNPSAIISGAAVISGTTVTQKVTGGVSGVIYGIECTVTTSAGDTLVQSGFFSVDPDLVT